MKFGVVISFGTVREYVAMAQDAEAAGWDGVFAWDDISVERDGVYDPWVVLGAMAAVTEGITSGTDHTADRAQLEPMAEAGATWFIESRWEDDQSADTVRERIRRGPPRL
jgi:alkanesulfonate monooxygenase SsuD/methylene tetrahydromethanopterin reductase-like flavin-dependent oxidoreductase (luciferase family)